MKQRILFVRKIKGLVAKKKDTGFTLVRELKLFLEVEIKRNLRNLL